MDSHCLELILSLTITVLCLQPVHTSLSADFSTGNSNNNDNNNNKNQEPSWLEKYDIDGKLLGSTNVGNNFRADELFLRKRSAAFGRAHFRPGKRTIGDDLNSAESVDYERRRPLATFSSFKELPMDYTNTDPYLKLALKRSVTTGRAHFRPAKRFVTCLTSADNDYGN